MENFFDENEFNYSSKNYRTPDGIPADIVIFTIASKKRKANVKALPERTLKVLLIQRKKWPFEGAWALPGGFSKEDETLLETAKRELKQETGIKNVHVEQFGVYSKPNRDPRGWIISSAYFALVNEEKLESRKAADDAADVALVSVEEALHLNLAFDHKQILQDAISYVQKKILMTDIAKEFLPKQFTLGELYQVIQTVVPSFKEEMPNFKRKVLGRNVIQRVEGEVSAAYSQRPAQLYTFTGYLPMLSIYN
jgi:8-oxo-dGTP diphosphatase